MNLLLQYFLVPVAHLPNDMLKRRARKALCTISKRHRLRLIKEATEDYAAGRNDFENIQNDNGSDAAAETDEGDIPEDSYSHNDHDDISNHSVSNSEECYSDSSDEEYIVPHNADNPLYPAVAQVEPEFPFSQQLANWAVVHQIPHTAVSALLAIWRDHPCHADLPKHAKTLLRTPRSTTTRPMSEGSYWHRGIRVAIEETFRDTRNLPENIEVQIGIDGLPISGSTTQQLWPILGSIISNSDVFLIDCYVGYKKPTDANQYLAEFVTEAIELSLTGFQFRGRTHFVWIHSIICDAPAKAFVTLTKGHSGYFSCAYCETEGEYMNGRLRFPELRCRKRTVHSFRVHRQEEHHLGRSILLQIPRFGLVSRVPLDYLHLVLIGVMKKLINLWLTGPLRVVCTT